MVTIRSYCISILCVAFFVCLSGCARWSEVIQEAEALIKNQKFEEAIALIDRHIDRSINAGTRADQARLYYSRGEARYALYSQNFKRGQADGAMIIDALSDFSRAIELTNLQFASAYSYRGMIYGMFNMYEHALADFNYALKLDPEQTNCLYQRAWIYKSQGRKAEALSDLRRYVERSTDIGWKTEAEKIIRELSDTTPAEGSAAG